MIARLGVALVFTLAFHSSIRSETLIEKINAALQASTGELQWKRSIVINEQNLASVDRVDAVLSFTEMDLIKLLPDALNRANKSKHFLEQRLKLKDGTLKIGTDRILASASVEKEFPDYGITIGGRATATGYPFAVQDKVYFGIHFDKLRVSNIKLARPNIDVSGAGAIITPVLNGILPVLNSIFDVYVNVDKEDAVHLSLQPKPLYVGTLREKAQPNKPPPDFMFDEKPIAIYATVDRAAALVENGRVLVIAKFVNRPAVKTTLPAPPDNLTSVSEQEMVSRLSAYRAAFYHAASKPAGADYVPTQAKTFVALSKTYLADVTREAIKGSPLCGRGNINIKPKPFSERLALDKLPTPQCEGITHACDLKEICSKENTCQKKVSREIERACKVKKEVDKVERILDPVRGYITRKVKKLDEVDDVCKVTEDVWEDIPGDLCKKYKQLGELGKAACDIATTLREPECQLVKLHSLCQAEKALRDFADKNPVAVIRGVPGGRPAVEACASAIDIGARFSSIAATLDGTGNGDVHVTITFDGKLPGHLTICASDWEEKFTFHASTSIVQKHVEFRPESEDRKDGIRIRFKTGDQELSFDLKESPFETIFAKHPQLIANCPGLPATAFAYAAYETAFKQKLKANPYFSGRGYEHEFKDVHFDVKIPNMVIRSKEREVLLTLKPKWGENYLVYD
jgi:hypothetical protein